ncbi:MAG: hypothetical protein AB8G05_21240 [Oligoflexales bacterium]
MNFILIKIMFFALLVSCDSAELTKFGLKNDQIDTKPQNLIFGTYDYDSSGNPLPATNTEVLKYELTSPNNSSLSLTTFDTRSIRQMKNADVFPAQLNSDLSMVNSITYKYIDQGCYFSAFDNEKEIFYLNPYVQIESFLEVLNEDQFITFSGILCLNQGKKVFSFAANHNMLAGESGINNIIDFLAHKNIEVQRQAFSLTMKAFRPKTGSSFKEHNTYPIPTKTFDQDVPSNFQRKRAGTEGWYESSEANLSKNLLKDTTLENIDIKVGSKGSLNDGSIFHISELLGSGSFGTVYRLDLKKDGKTLSYALKWFKVKQAIVDSFVNPIFDGSPFYLQNYGFFPGRTLQLTELGGRNLDDLFISGRIARLSAEEKIPSLRKADLV